MLPETSERVHESTADSINERIAKRTAESVAHCAAAGPTAIDERLAELDREWDIERALTTNASSLILAGIGLGAWVDRRFLALPAAVAGFLLQHALQGWCPPLPLFRRLGIRTQSEIDRERYALKALRGDFQDIRHTGSAGSREAGAAMQAVER